MAQRFTASELKMGRPDMVIGCLSIVVGVLLGTFGTAKVEPLLGNHPVAAWALGFSVAVSGSAILWARSSPFGSDLGIVELSGVCVAVLAMLSVTFNGIRVASFATFSDALWLVAMAPLSLSLARKSILLGRLPSFFVLACGSIFLAGLLSSLHETGEPAQDLLVTFEFMAAIFALPIAIAITAGQPRRFHAFVHAWLLSAAVNGLIAAGEILGIVRVREQLLPQKQHIINRFAGLATHPNHLALVCAMVFPAALLLLAGVRGLPRFFYSLIAMSTFAGLMVSGSRAGLGATGVGVALILFLEPRYRGRVLLILAAGLAMGIAAAWRLNVNVVEAFSTISRVIGADRTSVATSNEQRLLLAYGALEAFRENPITGSGLSEVRAAHDIYLATLQGGGLLMMSGFLAFVWWTIAYGLSVRHGVRQSEYARCVVTGLITAVIVFLAMGVFANAIYDRYIYVPIGLLLGCQLSSMQRENSGIWTRR